MTIKASFILSSMILASAGAAMAQSSNSPGVGGQPPAPRPESVDRVFACRSITAAEARLACFDRAVDAMEVAQRQGDVVVVDRATVREARRQLFGFQMPTVSLFEQGERPEALDAVETTLVRAGQAGEGRWTFTLANESVWHQIDSERVNFRNRPGQEVRVRRAALGSYLMTVGNSRAIRVRRQ